MDPSSRTLPPRTLAVWCEDWPVAAWGETGGRPVAVVRANRVVAADPVARRDGVAVGQRRRDAQRRSPHVVLHERDLDREARAFEQVVGALDAVTARLEISSPGCVRFPTRGPDRYFGGEAEVARRVRAAVEEIVRSTMVEAGMGVGIGVADGSFGATLAARRSARSAARGDRASADVVVDVGATPGFLAPVGIGALVDTGDLATPALLRERRELVEVLSRLGVRTLGDLARLGAADVAARFGPLGRDAHRLASGQDLQPLAMVDPPADLAVDTELDPPLERVEQAAFVAKALADRFLDGLRGRGLVARGVVVAAELSDGRAVERRWRHDGALTAASVAQRVRWQLDGWLTDRARWATGPDEVGAGGIVRLTLRPVEVGPDRGHQRGFWGGDDGSIERVLQSMARVQAMLGGDAVRVAEWRGGRTPAEQYRLVPLDTVELDRLTTSGDEPWPGRLAGVPPSLVWSRPRGIELFDDRGERLRVDGRGLASGRPGELTGLGGRREVTGWVGPWVTDERWWDPVAHRRRARFQLQLDDGTVHLVVLEAGRWALEATWD